MNKKEKRVLFYIRIIVFIISLIIDFLLIRAINNFGLHGFIFLTMELIYIIFVIYSLLIKSKECMYSNAFNIMQIGAYIYKIIIFIQTTYFKNLFLFEENIKIYRGNFILLSVLLLFIIFYEILLVTSKKNKV